MEEEIPMLEKEPFPLWVHCLKTIELFEAQVNTGSQIFFGRRMVHLAVDTNRLYNASLGLNPDKRAAAAVLQKYIR